MRSHYRKKVEAYLREIWGGMVNSMCHAWSCTATYFLRHYRIGL